MGNLKKSLNELTLLDRFLFDEVMENPENVEILLDIILGEEVVLKHLPQTEKELRKNSLKRTARIDVWAEDIVGAEYDIEAQKIDTGNLPKRSRYYQAMLDANKLKPGELNYNELNKVYLIMIMPFDLFGKGLYKYTFYNTCEEIPGLQLGDEVVRIFLNTKGTNDGAVSKNLVQLLHYMEYTNDRSIVFQDAKLMRLQQNVMELRQNAEVSVKYMQAWEELMTKKLEGEAVGIAKSVLSLLNDLGEVPADIEQKIMLQTDFDVLNAWLKKAARVESVQAFVETMNE